MIDAADPQPEASPAPLPWEIAIVRSWRKIAATLAAALALALVVWQLTHLGLAFDYAFHPEVVARKAFFQARMVLVGLAVGAGVLSLPLCVRTLRRVRSGLPAGPLHREIFLASLIPLPLLGTPGIEFDHPLIVSLIVIGASAALAWTLSRELTALPALPDLTQRQALIGVAAAVVVFAGVIGFLSYWRYITFHAQVCDSSWETDAIYTIVHHGYPKTSVGAWMYDGQPLPAPYFNRHVPFGSYLFAPFFVVYQKASTIVWMQAVFMSLGAIGAYFIGRGWLGSRAMGVLLAWVYVLNPSVQSLCLHDIHPNILVVPAVVLAVGLMESGRPRAAVACAIYAALCHEETPVYAAAIGLAWMLSGEDRRRFRMGLGMCVFAVFAIVGISGILMPMFGGQPRWEHFNFFFDERRSTSSLVAALILNPVGAILTSANDLKLDYVTMSLLPLGGLAIFGWRAAWFALPAVFLLVPAGTDAFFGTGINYSAPLVPAALLMGFAGLRYFWGRTPATNRARRAGIVGYVLATALVGNFLYGNIASKTYKLEYGQAPFRRQNQYNYRQLIGYMDALPPFGEIEKKLWEVVEHVPPHVPILTSWAVNPQLSTRDISLSFAFSGGTPAPEERVDYIVIDKLPQFQVPTEPEMARFRADPRFEITFENEGGVIFKRKR